MTRTVLCYGDSNTYGHATVPRPDGRYGPAERWPGVMRGILGAGWLVIEEGLGGRTTVNDDPVEGVERNGRTYLYPCLMSHKPLDVVIIMLGTNDLKPFLGRTAFEASKGIGRLIEIIHGHAAADGANASRGERRAPRPKIIIVAPPPLCATEHVEMHAHFDLAAAIAESGRFAEWYRRRADEYGVGFFDAGTVAKAHPADGVHLDAASTRAIGEGLVPVVKQVLGL